MVYSVGRMHRYTPAKQIGRCACGFTPAFGRVEPTHPHESAYEWGTRLSVRTRGGGGLRGRPGGMEEGRLVAAPAASLRPSAERNPLIREKPRMNGAPGGSV